MADLTVHQDALGFVRKHPEMFFGVKRPNALICLQYMVLEVLRARRSGDANRGLVDRFQ